MKRVIILFSIFIAALTSFAFADDEVKDYVTLPDARAVELPSLNATSSIYSIDDVYRILNSWNYPSGSSWIQTKDSALHLDLTTTNNRLNDIKSAINGQDFSQLHSDLTTVNTSITSGNTQNHSDLNTVNTSITSGNTQNHSDFTTLNTSITSGNTQNHNDFTSLSSDINNLNKTSVNITSFQGYDLNSNAVNPGTSNLGGFRFQMKTSSVPGNSIYILKLPVRQANGNNNADFTINFYMNTLRYNTNYTYFSDYAYTYVIFDYMPYYNANWVFSYEVLAQATMYYQTYNPEMYYISSDSSDYYLVSNMLYNRNNNNALNHIDDDIQYQNNVIDVFKSLYASDDLIAAKQAQQSVEDATLSDFTGNGSASAKVSDITSTKNAQKAVKDSLDTGASASNVSNIVGVNSGFFSFFSQSVSDSVNNPSLSRQTRDINNPDYVPDLLSQNEREYWRLINGDNR